MARGFEVAVGADGRAFNQSIRRDVIKPVEDAAKSLDELADAGDDAGRDVTRSLDRMEDSLKDVERAANEVGTDGKRSIGKLEDALRDAERQSKDTERAVDDIGDGGARSFGKIKAGADELTNEGFSNAAEAVSSFRGDVEDLGQIGQDTLGGLAATLSGLGPAGIVGAVGLAGAAAGWGLITQNIQDQQEAAEKLRERLRGAYQEAAEAGRDYLDVSQLIAEANDLMFNEERAEEWKSLQAEAKAFQLDVNTLIKANAGDLTALAVVRGVINERLQEQIDKEVELGDKIDQGGRVNAIQQLADKWEAVGDATADAAADARNAARITSRFLLDAARQAGEATSEVDKFGNELVKLPDGTEFVIDANTKQAHQNMDRFYGDVDGKIDRLNKKDIDLRVGVKDRTSAEVGAIVRRISGTTAYITVGARAGASVGAAIGRSQRG